MNIPCPKAYRATLCLVVYLALHAAGAAVCAAEAGAAESPRVEAYRANLLTPYEERIVGRRLAYLYEQRHEFSQDAETTARLDRIKLRLRSATALPELEIKIIRSPQPEAVSFPPGYIYITSSLVKLALTDDELAAVIAHEAAHITKRHLSGLIALALALPSSERERFPTRGAIVTGQAVRFAFPSQLNEARLRSEAEADKTAIDWMERAGYKGQALALLLESITARISLQAVNERAALRARLSLLGEEALLVRR